MHHAWPQSSSGIDRARSRYSTRTLTLQEKFIDFVLGTWASAACLPRHVDTKTCRASFQRWHPTSQRTRLSRPYPACLLRAPDARFVCAFQDTTDYGCSWQILFDPSEVFRGKGSFLGFIRLSTSHAFVNGEFRVLLTAWPTVNLNWDRKMRRSRLIPSRKVPCGELVSSKASR